MGALWPRPLAGYVTDNWNRFDFTLVALSLIDIDTCSDAPTSDFPLPAAVIRVLRLFRVVRVFRLIALIGKKQKEEANQMDKFWSDMTGKEKEPYYVAKLGGA